MTSPKHTPKKRRSRGRRSAAGYAKQQLKAFLFQQSYGYGSRAALDALEARASAYPCIMSRSLSVLMVTHQSSDAASFPQISSSK